MLWYIAVVEAWAIRSLLVGGHCSGISLIFEYIYQNLKSSFMSYRIVDALFSMEKAMIRDGISVNDRQVIKIE